MAEKKNFENNIDKLEKIIDELESGDAPLDKCIEMFEQGVCLSDECLKMLDTAQQKITLLSKNGETDFDINGESADE